MTRRFVRFDEQVFEIFFYPIYTLSVGRRLPRLIVTACRRRINGRPVSLLVLPRTPTRHRHFGLYALS